MPENKQCDQPNRSLPLVLFLGLAYVLLSITFDFMPWPGQSLAAGQAGIDLDPPVIRFHVLAHSDDPADQAVKNRVRDEALRYLSPKLSPRATLEEVESLLNEEKEKLKMILEGFLRGINVHQDVQIFYHTEEFPTRTYAGRVYPAGEYETFQIVLGEGQGQNWWCVMFPPLCLTELAIIPERPAQESLVDEDPPLERSVPGPAAGDKLPPSPGPLRLRIVEWFRKVFSRE
jgi:stage II sporulation protein R